MMNRRKLLQLLTGLAALPIVSRFLNTGRTEEQPCPWDIERYDAAYIHDLQPYTYEYEHLKIMDWGGDVGRKPTIVMMMRHGDVTEKHYYAEGWGIVHMTGHKGGVQQWAVTVNQRQWDTVEA